MIYKYTTLKTAHSKHKKSDAVAMPTEEYSDVFPYY